MSDRHARLSPSAAELQAQRLEAVGRLAAGVAHEINSPIQYVGDSLAFLRSALADLGPLLALLREAVVAPDRVGQLAVAAQLADAWELADADFLAGEVPRALQRSLDGVARVAEIVRALTAFAHPSSAQHAPADLNDALTGTLVIARNEYKYVADLECVFSPLPLVPCQLGELNEAFLSLILNAAQAVADSVQGTDRRGLIRVRTHCDASSVFIEIEDSGGGVPLELEETVFEPFFTTKAGKGSSGQGLTIARSIIASHGGALTLRSEPGKGSTFAVRLPVAPSAASAAPWP